MPVLSRAWQILLKGLSEVREAPSDSHAAEMVLVRLAYSADMPTPGELVAKLDAGRPVVTAAMAGASSALAVRADAAPAPMTQAGPRSFEEAVALFGEKREGIIYSHLVNDVHLVRFEPGKIEIRPKPNAPADLAHKISERLSSWTGRRWVVGLSNELGAPTIREAKDAAAAARRSTALNDPLVKAALEAFPGATVEAVRDATPILPLVGADDGDLEEIPPPDPEDDR
jgi:DNA polymerase-3 subunit gamma/tau